MRAAPGSGETETHGEDELGAGQGNSRTANTRPAQGEVGSAPGAGERAPGTGGSFGDTPGLNRRTPSPTSSSTPPAASFEAQSFQLNDRPTPAASAALKPDAAESASRVSVERASDERAGDAATRPRRRPVAVVEESLRPRVERLRDASVNMLDEAAEDSGLRFIIIAVALFILTLVFLLISNSLK